MMVKSLLRCGLALWIGLAAAHASDIQGTVIIKRKLTKRRVTPSASAYDRGATIALHSDAQSSLAFERERVVVYLEGDNLPSKPVTATMEQRDRRFIPDTLWLAAGSTVSFPNMDLVFHNVFSLSKPKSFDLGNFAKDHTRTVTFSKPGIVFVNCHLHPNMAAAIVISPNQWGTRVDGEGKFLLANVPPGIHTLVAWHRSAGFFRQDVTLTAAHGATAEFFIPLEANDYKSDGDK